MQAAVVAKQTPRFSWEIVSAQNGQRQTAWQVIVSDDPKTIETDEGNIWNSGKEDGAHTFGIKYDGDALQSFNKYYWKVRAWDRDGKVSAWSKAAHFITAAFDKKDWQANWIGDQPEPPPRLSLAL